MWTPIISAIAYHNSIYDNASAQVQAIRDALWSFGIIISAVAMAGNIIWLFKALQRKEAIGVE